MSRSRSRPRPRSSSRSRSRPAAASPPRLRVRRPADFLAVVPYLLGFHPSESVVVVLFRGGQVALTARLDLPDPAGTEPVLTLVRDLCRQHGVDELVLVAYGDDEPAAGAVLEQLLGGLTDHLRVREALLVSGGRWWSLTCRTGCCSPDGTPFDPAGHPLAAEAVYAGLAAETSRAVLEAQVEGPGVEELPRLAAALERAKDRVAALDRPAAAALMAATVRDHLADPAPQEEACTLLAVLALDLAVRDVAWALVTRDAAEDHVRLWSAVVRWSLAEVAAGPLGLLGVAAWVSGNGALLNCCVERLERDAPGYTLGHLLADISDRALPPSLWEELAPDLRREVAAVTGDPPLH